MNSLDFSVRTAVPRKGRLSITFGAERLAPPDDQGLQNVIEW